MAGPATSTGLHTSTAAATSHDHAASARGAGVPAAPSTPPAEEWRANWAVTLPELARITSSLHPRADVTIMRSSQLDAARLDEELTSMLRDQFMRAFRFLFRPGAVARLQPELTLLLDFLIFRFSIWEGQPLPGMALMNLRYRNEAAVQQQQPTSLADNSSGSGSAQLACPGGGHSGVEGPGLGRAQRSLYCLGAVVLQYAWARLGHFAAAQHWGDASSGSSGYGSGWSSATWRRRTWELMRRAESAYRLASLVNFLAFLRSGRYRSLLERLLRARMVYQQPSAARAISFEYLNRQLVWSELSELLLFLLPLFNVKAIKHLLRSYLPRLPILGAGGGLAAAVGGGMEAQGGGVGKQRPCGICSSADILAPFAAVPCGHRFCYYCLRSHCLADPQYSCPLCLQRVDAMQRVQLEGGSNRSTSDGGDDSSSKDAG